MKTISILSRLLAGLALIAPGGVWGIPAAIRVYNEDSPYPSELRLVIATSQSVPNLTMHEWNGMPSVSFCSNGTWLLYPEEDFIGEPMVLGLLTVPFCLSSGAMRVKSIQLVGDGTDISTRAITTFPLDSYAGIATTLPAIEWSNTSQNFTSFILTGVRNDEISLFREPDMGGNGYCVIRRSFVRNVNEFGFEPGTIASIKLSCF